MDPYAQPPVGTFLPVVTLTLVDQDDDGDIDRFGNDTIDGQDVTQSYPGDTVTVNLTGGGQVTYVGTTFYLADGRQVFTPTDGQVLQEGTFGNASAVTTQGPLDVPDLGPPCFVAGTLIGNFSPIRFDEGALGNDKPMLLSPQHRVLLRGWRAEMLFGEAEVLVSAKHLINDLTIRPAPRRSVTYYHILFDQHELLWSDGALTESFFPGDTIMSGNDDLRAEIEALFPELLQRSVSVLAETARRVLRPYELIAYQSA